VRHGASRRFRGGAGGLLDRGEGIARLEERRLVLGGRRVTGALKV